MVKSTHLPPALLAKIRAVCPGMKLPFTPAKLLTRIRRVAGPRVTVWGDRNAGAYRATCDTGFRFDVELHELVSVYWTQSTRVMPEDRVAALVELLYAFGRPSGDRAERCTDTHCDWCGR